MNRLVIMLGVVAALTGTAFAGRKFLQQVHVDTVGGGAQGSIGDARASADANQFIGCYDYARSNFPTMAVCHATDAIGTSLFCQTTTPSIVEAVHGINALSWLSFTVDANGTCTSLVVDNESTNTPAL